MKYELILQDNKKIILNEAEANIVEKGIFARQDIFKIGLNLFKRSAIKGLFQIQEEVSDNKEQWLKDNVQWNEVITKKINLPLEDKITKELTERIFPGLKLNNIILTDDQIAIIEFNIRHFFENNKRYPCCPFKIWWPFIVDAIAPIDPVTKKQAKPILSYWWKIIKINDNAIEEWLKYN